MTGRGWRSVQRAVHSCVLSMLAVVLGTWFVTMLLFGFVGFASIVATAALPLALALRAAPLDDGSTPLVAFGIACALLVSWTHRGNLRRMRAGTEPRARRLWLLGRLLGRLRGGNGA